MRPSLFPYPQKTKKNFFKRKSGNPGQDTQNEDKGTRERTRETTGRHHTTESTMCYVDDCEFFQDSTWSGAVHEAQCDAALQIGHGRCRRRSRRHVNELRLGRRVWHGRVVRAVIVGLFCHRPYRRTLLSRFWRDMLGEELAFGVEFGGVCDGSFELVVAVRSQATPASRPRPVHLTKVRDCASCPLGRRLAPPCLVHGQAFVKDRAGKRGARLPLDAALEAAEDGYVAGLQVRRALWREEAQHDVRECGLHGCQCGFAGVDAGHVPQEDPRLPLSARVQHVVKGGRELQDRGRRGPAVV